LSAKIDLKDIERRAYTSYHEDGIIDIFIGLGLISMSFYVYAEMAWLMGSFVAIFVPVYMNMKKNVTFLRLGQVTFSKRRAGRTLSSYIFLFAMNVAALLLAVSLWRSFSGGSPPSWLPLLRENYAIVAGAVGAGVFAVLAYLTDLARFYRYAAATLVVLGSAYFIPIPFIAHVAVLGAIIGAAGYLQLEGFKRRYPLMEEN
jgi:hypothetical protein